MAIVVRCSALIFDSGAYNTSIMPSPNLGSASVSEICAKVKNLGYAASAHVRLYGEDFEVLSDPFPEAGGIAVHVRTKKDSKVRLLRLPATVLQSVGGRAVFAA
jgi:hypothetical protein